MIAPAHVSEPDLSACERALCWRGRSIPIGVGGECATGAAPLPPELVAALALLERDVTGHDLARACTLVLARELGAVVVARARALGRLEGDARADVSAWPALEQVELMAAVVASRLTYDTGQVGGLLARIRSTVEGVLAAWSHPVKRARRLLARSSRGVCRDYAQVMTTTMYALRRIAREPSRALLPCVMGDPVRADGSIDPRGAHVWNLLACPDEGTLHAIDVTWADANHEASRATGARMPAGADGADGPGYRSDLADLARHRHVSALLASLAWGYGVMRSPLYRRPEVEAVFAAAIDSTSPRGQLLLLHLAEHLATPSDAERLIRRHLERVGFDVEAHTVPSPTAVARKALLQRLETPGQWHALLARAGVLTDEPGPPVRTAEAPGS